MGNTSEQTVGRPDQSQRWSSRIIGSTRILGGILFLAMLHNRAQAELSVTLAWDPSSEATVVGCKMYYGVASRTYTNMVDVGNVTNGTITGLVGGTAYYFAVTAYNASGLESDFSNEVGYTVPLSNSLPSIVLTSPVSGTGYIAPAIINLAADVTANGNTITKVQFYNGTTLVGESTSSPYSFAWSSVSAGSYSLSARVIYGAGITLDSSAANVSVTNLPPTIVLTAPLNGASYPAPATISFTASVTANGHSIMKVQFYNGTTLLGEDTSTPYSFTWNSVSAGSYSLAGRAVYDVGSTVDSPPASVMVTNPTPAVVADLPAPWQTVDIGGGGVVGSASASNGLYTVKGAGNISGTSDSFRFVHQPLSGDGEIKVRLTSVEDTGTSGRIGVMIRESLTSGSEYAFMGISPDGTFRWQRRSRTAANSSSTTSTIGTPPNVWVRLLRTGNTLYGYRSSDGTTWTQVNSRNITMAANIYVGLTVASGSSNTLTTATFNNVTVIP